MDHASCALQINTEDKYRINNCPSVFQINSCEWEMQRLTFHQLYIVNAFSSWHSLDITAQLCSVIFENGGHMFLLERKPIVLGIRKPKNIEFGIILLTFCGFSCWVRIKEDFVFWFRRFCYFASRHPILHYANQDCV